MALKLRRGTEAERLTITPAEGELIYTTDTKKIYTGDGVTVGGNLVSGLNNIVEDVTPQLGGDLDLNSNNIIGNGNINITGSITATGDINIGDGTEDSIVVGGQISSHLTPSLDESYDLGSNAKRWRNIWASGLNVTGALTADSFNGDIIADDSTLLVDVSLGTINATALTGALPAIDGSAVTGVTASGPYTGDLTGSVFADDSTILVDGVAGVLKGTLEGQLDGNVIGTTDSTIFITGGAGINGADVRISAGVGTALGGDVFINAGGGGTDDDGVVFVGNTNTLAVKIYNSELRNTNILRLDDTLLLDGTTGELDLSRNSLNDLSDVVIDAGDSTAAADGSILAYDSNLQAYRPVEFFQAVGGDQFDRFKGHLDGTFQGNIVSDDSTAIFDGFTKSLLNLNSVTSQTVETTNTGSIIGGELVSDQFTGQGQGQIVLRRTVSGTISDTRSHGNIKFEKQDDGGNVYQCSIAGGENFLRFINDPTGIAPGGDITTNLSWYYNKLGVGYRTPTGDERLQVNGDANITGYIQTEQVRIEGNAVKATESNANLQLVPNGTGTVELNVPTQSTVGAAGAASAIPATPDIYFKVNVGGTEYVVPGFAVS